MPFTVEYAWETGFYEDNIPLFFMKGWTDIDPGKCMKQNIHDGTPDVYYVRSRGINGMSTSDWAWGGNSDMCILLKETDFARYHDHTYPDSNGKYPLCLDIRGAKYVGGHSFPADGGSTWYINKNNYSKSNGKYPPAKIESLTIDKSSVIRGGNVILGWSGITRAESCSATSTNNVWTGSKNIGGDSEVVGPLTKLGNHSFKLTCKNIGGQTTSKTVNVNVEPHTVSVGEISVAKQDEHESYIPVTLSIDSVVVDGENAYDLLNSVQWSSNIDGDLGSNTPFSKSLSPGNHTITASINFEGDIGTAQTTVNIIENQPYLDVSLPVAGKVFDIYENVEFDATVKIASENVDPTSIAWVSDISGEIGSGRTFTRNDLPEGKHTITVSFEANGIVAEEIVTVTIYDREKNLGNTNPGQCLVGNPINLVTGNKYHEEVDFSTATESPIYVKRSYNSSSNKVGLFGYGWNSNIEERVELNDTAEQAAVVSANASVQRFDLVNGVWVDASSSKGTLERLHDGSWKYTLFNKTVKTYNSQGQILKIKYPNGFEVSYNYSNGRLQNISDIYGYEISFAYNAAGFVESMTNPDDYTTNYLYNGQNLEYVIYPDLTPGTLGDNPRKQYLYEKTEPGFEHLLTGLIDEENIRFATWDYNEVGQAIYSKHSGGAEKMIITRNLDGTITTENALGKQTTYHYESIKGFLKITDVEGHQSNNCNATWQSTTYHLETGFAHEKTDWRGNKVVLEHNEYGQVTTSTLWDYGESWGGASEDSGISVSTTIQYNDKQLPEFIIKPGVTIEKRYTPEGRIYKVISTDTTTHTEPYSTNGEVREITYSYTFHSGTPIVKFVDIDGPRADVDDSIRQEYDLKGNLIKVTNALGHTLEYRDYLSNGLYRKQIDANGKITDYSYTSRYWLEAAVLRSSKGDAETSYQYYHNGLIKKQTNADLSYTSYFYNDSRQIDYIQNNLGEKIDYTPNIMTGEWETISYKTAGDVVRYQRSRQFNEMGYQYTSSSAEGHDVTLDVDASGNVRESKTEVILDGDVEPKIYSNLYFDAQNRARRASGDDTASIGFSYNEQGVLDRAESTYYRVVKEGLHYSLKRYHQQTDYVYNGFGELIYRDSGATGESIYYRDLAGNVVREVNAKLEEIAKQYDALNRIKTVAYADAPEENISYQYDQGVNAIGRLSNITDESGSRTLSYDDQGFIDLIEYDINGQPYSIDYDIDSAGRLKQITYPSDRVVEYSYDSLGRVDGITMDDVEQGIVNIISNVQYEPFGPIKSYRYGNVATRNVSYDSVYRTGQITHNWGNEQESIAYGYDTADRLRTQIQRIDGAIKGEKHFEYDRAGRLEEVSWAKSNGINYNKYDEKITYTYSRFGNRTREEIESATLGLDEYFSYRISAVSNQIKCNLKGGTCWTVNHDELGNLVFNSSQYNKSNRLASLNVSGVDVNYLYNALGQRVQKDIGGEITQFHYDLSGQLIAENDANGNILREYIYLGSVPVAMVAGDSIYNDGQNNSSTLYAETKLKVSSFNSTESKKLMSITDTAVISTQLKDKSSSSGTESYGLTIRETQAGGAKVDVEFTAFNKSTMSMLTVNTPEGKIVPIITWGNDISEQKMEITVGQTDGSTTVEVLDRQGEYVKLERDGNTINVYVSNNGASWSLLRQYNVPMSDQAYMGAIATNASADFNAKIVVPNDNLFYLHTDHLGSVYAATSNASKTVVWRRKDFDLVTSPFGYYKYSEVDNHYQGIFEMPLRFPGQYADNETGLYYNYFRYYDPKTGRYITSDPIGLEGGMNTYVYVGGNPLSFIDPDGKEKVTFQGKHGKVSVMNDTTGYVQWFPHKPEGYVADLPPGNYTLTYYKYRTAFTLKKEHPHEPPRKWPRGLATKMQTPSGSFKVRQRCEYNVGYDMGGTTLWGDKIPAKEWVIEMLYPTLMYPTVLPRGRGEETALGFSNSSNKYLDWDVHLNTWFGDFKLLDGRYHY